MVALELKPDQTDHFPIDTKRVLFFLKRRGHISDIPLKYLAAWMFLGGVSARIR